MTNEAFNIREEPAELDPGGEAPSSGVEYLAQLFAVMDRQRIWFPILQGLVAAFVGFLLGSKVETSGWFLAGDGSPLDGELSLVFAAFLGFGWWMFLLLIVPPLRQAFYKQFISQFNSTYLVYLLLEHRSHDGVAPLLARDPIFPWVTRIRTHEPFALRIRSFIMQQPAICRTLGMADYPAKWGRILYLATIGAAACIVLGFFTPAIWQASLWFTAWLLIAGSIAFRQTRIQALSYTIASFFVRWLDAY